MVSSAYNKEGSSVEINFNLHIRCIVFIMYGRQSFVNVLFYTVTLTLNCLFRTKHKQLEYGYKCCCLLLNVMHYSNVRIGGKYKNKAKKQYFFVF